MGSPASPETGLKTSKPSPVLVDATAVIPDLVLDIRYATKENFLKKRLYPAARCLLRPSVAEKLAKAQRTLRIRGFGLKVFDCYRPFSIQKVMWEAMPVRGLVAPPSIGGSLHNRGAAVDVSMVRLDGAKVEMPTDFDDFGKAARINSTLPSTRAQKNRSILQRAMIEAGFKPTYMEWWHFDDTKGLEYKLLDSPLE
jgi:D-alanyl-D-alanine dipeptidase